MYFCTNLISTACLTTILSHENLKSGYKNNIRCCIKLTIKAELTTRSMGKEQFVPTKASSSRSSKSDKSESVLCLTCDEDQADTEEETDPGNKPCRFHNENFPFASSEDNINLETCCQLRVKHFQEEFAKKIGGRTRICLFPDCTKLQISGFSTWIGHGATNPWVLNSVFYFWYAYFNWQRTFFNSLVNVSMIKKGLLALIVMQRELEGGEYYFFLFPSDLHVVTDNLPCQLISARCQHNKMRAQCNDCYLAIPRTGGRWVLFFSFSFWFSCCNWLPTLSTH